MVARLEESNQPSVGTQILNEEEMVGRRMVSVRSRNFLAALLTFSKVLAHLSWSF